MRYLIILLFSVVSLQAQFLSNGRGGSGSAPLAASIYYVSINGNDSTAVAGDATKAYAKLSAAVSNAVNNSVIYVFPDTQVVTPYLVQEPDLDSLATAGTVNFINKTNITIRGPGAILYGAGQGDLMIIKDSDNITIDGLTFHGNRPTTNAVCVATNYGHVFMSGGGDNINFKNCTFKEFGQYGICHTDNINESAADNVNRVSIIGCVFINGGATNVVGNYNRGGAIGIRARSLSVDNSSFDNVVKGVVSYNQVNLGSSTATNTLTKVTASTFNNIWDSVVFTKLTGAGLSYTNEQTIIFSGNTVTDLGLLYPNNLGDPVPTCIYGESARSITMIGNSIAGNFGVYGLVLTPKVRSCSLIISDNIFRNMLFGILSSVTSVNNWVENSVISNNTFDNIGAGAINFQGKNVTIKDNYFRSACTNSATYSSLAQIAIVGAVSGFQSTNITVRGNTFTDNISGSPGNSILFAADTNCFDVRFEDNMTLGRLSAVTNNYIRHFGTGSVKHRYRFTSANSTLSTCFAHYFPFTNGQSGVFSVNAIGSTVVTGTNWVASQIKLCSFKNYLGNVVHYTTGTGLNANMSVIDPPLAGFSADMIGTNGYIYTRHTVPSGMTIPNNVEVIISLTK